MGQKSDRAREVGKPDISNNADLVKPSFLIFLLFLFFFEQTSPFTPKSGLNCSVYLCIDDHGSFRNLSVGFSPTQTSLRSVLRPRLLVQTPFPGSGMPNQVHGVLFHTMSGTELS